VVPPPTAVLETPVPGWQIVEYAAGEGQPPRYAAVQLGRPRAWGLRTAQAAARWVDRLTTSVQEAQLPVARPAA
jgi:hypothetical protein